MDNGFGVRAQPGQRFVTGGQVTYIDSSGREVTEMVERKVLVPLPTGMGIEEATARLMFGAEIDEGTAAWGYWCLQIRIAARHSFPLNPIIAWAVAANGGRHIACAQNR